MHIVKPKSSTSLVDGCIFFSMREKQKLFAVILFVASLIALFALVFYWASPKGGALASMPIAKVDSAKLDFALRRLKKRANSLSMESYHQELLTAYQSLNLAEVQQRDSVQINRLTAIFLDRTRIAQTAKKERYILFGDYLAFSFEKQLIKVLTHAQKKGMKAVLQQKDESYEKLIALSGNFLLNMYRSGMITERGELSVEKHVPQILFRKRWRVLGGLPFRYQFLEIESFIDAKYMLEHASSFAVDDRLTAIKRIAKMDLNFDSTIATALVYYESKEMARAIGVLKNANKDRPDDFTLNEFLLFLTNQP